MVELLDNCKPFLDFGMNGEVQIPSSIYEDFVNVADSLFVYARMKGYEVKHTHVLNGLFSFKFMIDGNRAFTIQILSKIDKYRNLFSVTLLYHFHYDYNKHMKYREIVKDLYEGYRQDDNAVYLNDESEIINGLKKLQTII
jgi:hypothetical protein